MLTFIALALASALTARSVEGAADVRPLTRSELTRLFSTDLKIEQRHCSAPSAPLIEVFFATGDYARRGDRPMVTEGKYSIKDNQVCVTGRAAGCRMIYSNGTGRYYEIVLGRGDGQLRPIAIVPGGTSIWKCEGEIP
jgi:hypothetical protein